ncbi:MAG: fumarylacetoacetase, partial [Betaproteobacteria bacterium]
MAKITQGSWVESANRPGSDFPIENLPFGTFRRGGPQQPPRVGVAICDKIQDCTSEADILGAEAVHEPLRQRDLNAF